MYYAYNLVIVVCMSSYRIECVTKLYNKTFFSLNLCEDTHCPKRKASSSIITQAVFGVAAIQSPSLAPYRCNVATLQK